MRCEKCDGLYVGATWTTDTCPVDVLRCVNCGRVRFGHVHHAPARELAGWQPPRLWPLAPREEREHACR